MQNENIYNIVVKIKNKGREKVEFQIKVLQALQGIRNDYLTTFFIAITMVAEKFYMILFLAFIYWCIDKKKGMRLGFIVLFNGVINSVIKGIVKMPRPFEKGVVSGIRVNTATGYSFPSGHTQTAVSFWMGIMLILKTKASIIVGCIMIALTAFSRMYLGVHWPMDVMGAILFGIIFTYFAEEIFDAEKPIEEGLVIISSVGMLAILLFKVEAGTYQAVAAMWGLCLGSYLEQKYIKFEEKATSSQQLIKIGIGILGMLIIYGGMEKLLPQIKVVDVLKHAFVILWIIAGAPFIFTKLRK